MAKTLTTINKDLRKVSDTKFTTLQQWLDLVDKFFETAKEIKDSDIGKSSLKDECEYFFNKVESKKPQE